MSHASPQSLFERQAGVRVAVPTVVGMAYTVGKHMLQMRSTHWTQTARQTTMDRTHVQPLVEHIKLALKRYKGEVGNFNFKFNLIFELNYLKKYYKEIKHILINFIF